ncbi:unnamed protein product, partial [Allacma fusca]
RLGGRLRQADLPYDRRHPVLLPRHHVTDLIVQQQHILTKHGDTQLIFTMVQQYYSIIRRKSLDQRIIRSCKICLLNRAQ